VTRPAERQPPQLADNDRREIAKRIFDALCMQYPEKYIALVLPPDPVLAVPNENWSGISQCGDSFTMVFEQYNAPAVAARPARLLAEWLRIYVGLVPTWRAEYFERAGSQTQRPIIIAAQNVADALEEVRARMPPTCCRAEVTKLDPDTETRRPTCAESH
jgi:hypothetical protein